MLPQLLTERVKAGNNGGKAVLQAKAKWITAETDATAAQTLADELGLSTVLARLLVARGLADPTRAAGFLYGGEDIFHDPFMLDGMRPAVERIGRALKDGEKLLVYGDYDADGVCSTALMSRLMATLGANSEYYIPHRQHEGYGLNNAAIDDAAERGIKLIITVDNGISAVEQIAHARERGIDVIVTDHHEPPTLLPEAYALINPKKPGCPYPFKELAGVGVAWKLAHALLGDVPRQWLELAAIGTIADLMPLQGENRTLVKLGLEQIRSAGSPGIRALLDVADIDPRQTSAGHVGFSLAPRINASGRMERADTAVACLIADDAQQAAEHAGELDRLNRERQQLVDEMAEQAIALAEKLREAGMLEKVLVLSAEQWNVGVAGIVASKVLERYYRPTIILCIDPATGKAKGSARSIPGFDMYEAMSSCAELFDHYGGHKAAAGMTLSRELLPDLHRALNDYADNVLTEEQLQPQLRADLELRLDDISPEMIGQLELLAPFGMNNPSPRFIISGLQVKDTRLMGRDRQHVKLQLADPGNESLTLEAVGFGKAAWCSQLSATAKVDVVGEASINEWNGQRKAQLIVQDLRVPHRQAFDWRGRGASDGDLRRWLGGDGAEQRGIVVFRRRDASLLLAECGGAAALRPALWLFDEAGRFAALNEQARSADPASVADMLLYALPPDKQRMELLLPLCAGAERLYALLRDTTPFAAPPPPDREQFKRVYAALMREPLSELALERRFVGSKALTAAALHFIIAVFEDLRLIERSGELLQASASTDKKELSSSSVYSEHRHRDEVERTFVYSSAAELSGWLLARLASGSALQSWEVSV